MEMGGLENRGALSEGDISLKSFKNQLLNGEDSAFIEGGKLAFTTDSFTVSPICRSTWRYREDIYLWNM